MTTDNAVELDARAWSNLLAPYKLPSNTQAVFELIVTLIPFFALWYVMYLSLQIHYALTLSLAVPTGMFLVRVFIIQHDCGHGSFFKNQTTNRWLGRVLGVLTCTPYDLWQRNHALHHAGSGALEHRGIGDITTYTVDEYNEKSTMGKFSYRLYRSPIVLFLIGPAYVFLLEHRYPKGMTDKLKPWLTVMLTNLGIILVASLLVVSIGFSSFIAIQLPVTIIAASLGVWLFYVQHQFEETVWDEKEDWDRREAAMHGSSHYDLPLPLRWLSGNIGIHHVHHLSSHIPFYKLPQVLKDYPELKDISRLTLWESFKCVKLTLWDPKSYRLISFREAKAIA